MAPLTSDIQTINRYIVPFNPNVLINLAKSGPKYKYAFKKKKTHALPMDISQCSLFISFVLLDPLGGMQLLDLALAHNDTEYFGKKGHTFKLKRSY